MDQENPSYTSPVRGFTGGGSISVYLLDPLADPLDPLCKEEPQTIAHWLRRRPRLDATRQNIYGSPSPPLKVLTTDPDRVLALTRVTLG